MIDYDRFWAEPGTRPGMTDEDAAEQLRLSSAALGAAFGIQGGFDPSMIPGMDPGPGRTPEQIAAWERSRGVRLPEALRQAFARQDGGFVYETELRILPLDEIDNPDDELWEFADFGDVAIPDEGLVFEFALDEFSGRYLLQYSPDNTDGEPAVFIYHSDPGSADRCNKSATEFFERMLKTDDAPSVDWSETAAITPVARETIDLSRLHGGRPAEKEQILARVGGALVLYVRERTPASESYRKTVLPEPLSKDSARLRQYRPAPVSTHNLILQPEETDGIVATESQRTRDGRWKNSSSRGVPVYVSFESTDQGKLKALRRELFDEGSPGRDPAEEQRRQNARGAVQKKIDEILSGNAPLPPGAPPEAAALYEIMQQKIREIRQRTGGQGASLPPGLEPLPRSGKNDAETPRLFDPAAEESDPGEESGE